MKMTIWGAFLLLLPLAASASNVIWDYATGQGTTTGQVNPGVTGEYRYDWANPWAGFGTATVYTIPPNALVPYPGSWVFDYATPPGTAAWTGMAPNGQVTNLGTYTFIYQFDNPTDSTAGLFDMSFVVDDKVTDVLLNGVSIWGSRGALGSWLSITTVEDIPVDLLSGTNTLKVVVTNLTPNEGNQVANMGIGATYQVSVIPEPGSLMLLSTGSIGLFLRRRKVSCI